MRILVVGASGFLGRSFLAAASGAGHEGIAAVRRSTRVVEAIASSVTIADASRLRPEDVPHGVGAVVNFATATEGDADAMTKAAVEMAKSVLAAAVGAGVPRLIHVSSMSAHAGPIAVDPEAPGGYALERFPERRGAYALSKTRAEAAVIDAARATDSLDVVVVRPGLVFGREMTDPLAGTAVVLPLGLAVGLGRPEQGAPWVDVDDLNHALLRIAEQPVSPGAVSVYDLLSGAPAKRDLLVVHRRLTGQPPHVLWLPLVVPLAAGISLDLLRRRLNRTAYAVRRMYRFDPRELEYSAVWQRLEARPHAELRGSVLRALTPEPSLDAPADERLRERAATLLRVEHRAGAVRDRRKAVLIGAGRIVNEMHLPALAQIDELDVAAVVDSRLDAARAVAVGAGAEAFASLDEVPGDIVRDSVVVVATPGASHSAFAIAAFERGASVIVEKPAALSLAEFEQMQTAAGAVSASVFHNYRLRPATLAFWRFVLMHDVGPLVRIRVRFASTPIRRERARWMHDERLSRSLLYEMAVHVLDLAFVVGGELVELEAHRARVSEDGFQTISFTGSGRLESCDDFRFDLDLTGTAPGVSLSVEFARSACVLDFYPDGFRVLPRRSNPLDDAMAAFTRLGGAVALRARRDRAPLRARPHELIYRDHLRALAVGGESTGFGFAAIQPTMTSLQLLAEALYDDVPLPA